MRGILARGADVPLWQLKQLLGRAGVIECRPGKTGRRFVAILAHIARSDVIGVLANRGCAIVAAEAVLADPGMVEHSAREARGRLVAILTDVGRIDMRGILARRAGAIVAGEAVARRARMIEGRPVKAGR